MTTKRPPYQLELDLPMPGRGEAPRRDAQEVEVIMATGESESPASTEHLMEAICAPDNIGAAVSAVVRNKGAPGIDGITVRPQPRHSEVGGIEHLMQLALGMMDGDGPSWRPILGDVDPIRYRS